jgi:hypothetical protein
VHGLRAEKRVGSQTRWAWSEEDPGTTLGLGLWLEYRRTRWMKIGLVEFEQPVEDA